MKIRLAIVALLLSQLCACATTHAPVEEWVPQIDPAIVASGTRITHDEYKKTTNFLGANSSHYNSLYLRGWRDDRTKQVAMQIYATSFYSGEWHFYNEAYDSDGNRMDFISIDRKVDSCDAPRGCYYEEAIGLNVSREYLEAHRETGVRFKASGKAGEFTGFLPPAYVKGFLASVDAAG